MVAEADWGGGGGAWGAHAPPSTPPPPPPPPKTEQVPNTEFYRALSFTAHLAHVATLTQRTSLYESLLHVLQT